MERWLAKETARHDTSLFGYWPLSRSYLDYSGSGNHTHNLRGIAEEFIGSRGGGHGIYMPYCWGLAFYTPDIGILDYNNKFTISCWVWRDGTSLASNPEGLVTRDNSYSDNSGSGVTIVSGNFVKFWIKNSGNGVEVQTVNPLLNNGWRQVVVTYDGSGKGAGVKIYFSGRRQDLTSTGNDSISASSLSTYTITMGNLIDNGAYRLLNGLLSSVRIYRRCLNHNEISELYNRERRIYQRFWTGRSILRPKISTLSLYLAGYDNSSSGLTLSATGSLGVTNSFNLSTTGIPGTTQHSLPLTVRVDDTPFINANIPAIIVGRNTVNAGMVGGIDLFTLANVGDNIKTRTMPLFISVFDSDRTVRNMNLWTAGENHRSQNTLELFIANLQQGINSSVPLYIWSAGANPGWFPLSKSLNLMLQRNLADAIPLYIQGPGTPFNNSLELFTKGGYASSASVNLSLADVLGFIENGAKLYVHGF